MDQVDKVVWVHVATPVVLAGARIILVAGYSSSKTVMMVL